MYTYVCTTYLNPSSPTHFPTPMYTSITSPGYTEIIDVYMVRKGIGKCVGEEGLRYVVHLPTKWHVTVYNNYRYVPNVAPEINTK